jgi:hypothetical protein
VAGRDLAAQDGPHRGDLIRDGMQRAGPTRIDELGEGTGRHEMST